MLHYFTYKYFIHTFNENSLLSYLESHLEAFIFAIIPNFLVGIVLCLTLPIREHSEHSSFVSYDY